MEQISPSDGQSGGLRNACLGHDACQPVPDKHKEGMSNSRMKILTCPLFYLAMVKMVQPMAKTKLASVMPCATYFCN